MNVGNVIRQKKASRRNIRQFESMRNQEVDGKPPHSRIRQFVRSQFGVIREEIQISGKVERDIYVNIDGISVVKQRNEL